MSEILQKCVDVVKHVKIEQNLKSAFSIIEVLYRVLQLNTQEYFTRQIHQNELLVLV